MPDQLHENSELRKPDEFLIDPTLLAELLATAVEGLRTLPAGEILMVDRKALAGLVIVLGPAIRLHREGVVKDHFLHELERLG